LSNDWTPAQRLAFRFGVVYLALFGFATQISGSLISNPWFTYRGLGRLSPMREVTHWVARTVLGVDVRLDDVSGGETLFFWIQWLWVLIAAIVVTMAWTLLARRKAYTAWTPWCRLAMRLALAASMIEYGMTKVLTTQFPAPPLTALVTPVGDMTLSALLWTTIGSAPAYQIVTGCVEVLAGVLLLLPWTVPLGAVLALVSLLQVLLLNLTFDIGVKLVTFHLMVLAMILLVPIARQLAVVLIRLKADATTDAPTVRLPPSLVPSFGGPGKPDTPSIAIVLPIALGAYLLGTQAWINWSFWEVSGGGRPTSVFYGIWNVERLSVDGQVRPAELHDYDRRWRRVIFDSPEAMVVQRTDDSFARYGASIDRGRGTIALTKSNSRTWASRFIVDRASDDQMTVAGEMDGHRIEADLRRVDPSAFPLMNSSFRWIRPHDP